MAEVTVVAQYQVKAGYGDEVAKLLGPHITATRAEPGCREFTALRSATDPDHFLLYERYDSAADFETHRNSPHFAAYVEAQIWPLLEERSASTYTGVPGT